MSSVYPGRQGRQRAIQLRAADARALLQSKLPYVFRLLTPQQIGQVQKVLDAAVVNPVVQKDYAEASRKNKAAERARGVFTDGSGAYRTPDSSQMLKLSEELIEVTAADKHIRLQPAKLLAHDALKPLTDNPDEATYLKKIMRALADRGVYLRIEPSIVRDPDDQSSSVRSNKEFDVWLSFGFDGDAIPTKTGRLTRDNLLDTTTLGAGYYTQVIKGGVQSRFDRTADRLSRKIRDGLSLHQDQAGAREAAAPGVVLIADYLGDADYPSQRIWDPPSTLLIKARKLNIGGDIVEASRVLTYAALVTDKATRRLNNYIDATVRGAGRAVGALVIVKEVAEIIETALLVWSLAGAALRFAATEAIAGGAKAAGRRAIDRLAFEKMLQVGSTGADKLELEMLDRAVGWTADVGRVFDAAAKRGIELSENELDALCKAADAKWGNPGSWARYVQSGLPQRPLTDFSGEVSSGVRKYFIH